MALTNVIAEGVNTVEVVGREGHDHRRARLPEALQMGRRTVLPAARGHPLRR